MEMLIRWLLGGLLIYAAVIKLSNCFQFAIIISQYDIIGPKLSRWTATFLPMGELLTGIFLISGQWRRLISFLTALLFSLFLIMVLQALVRGLNVSCGCYHLEGQGSIGILKVLENTILAAFAWLIYYLNRNCMKDS
ncbi:DoxX family membrane protein [bacterium]|nr:DoxX family membrane protein [bacterium]